MTAQKKKLTEVSMTVTIFCQGEEKKIIVEEWSVRAARKLNKLVKAVTKTVGDDNIQKIAGLKFGDSESANDIEGILKTAGLIGSISDLFDQHEDTVLKLVSDSCQDLTLDDIYEIKLSQIVILIKAIYQVNFVDGFLKNVLKPQQK